MHDNTNGGSSVLDVSYNVLGVHSAGYIRITLCVVGNGEGMEAGGKSTAAEGSQKEEDLYRSLVTLSTIRKNKT